MPRRVGEQPCDPSWLAHGTVDAYGIERTDRVMDARTGRRHVLGALAMLALGACAKPMDHASSPPPVPVTVAAAAARTVPMQLRAVGDAEPLAVVAVKAQVSAQLMRVHFQEGQEVTAGDVLFTLDRRPFETALQQAQANLARDQAQAANAKAQAERAARMVVPGVISQEQYEQSMAQAKAAEATVQADRAAVASSRLELDYCTIRAPLGGRTGNLVVSEGNLVKAEDSTPLVVINTLRPMYVAFALPEQDLPQLQRYLAHGVLPVSATIPGDDDGALAGQVSFVDNQVDRSTGTIRLKATFANDDRRLWPGQYVNIALTLTERPGTVVVPAQAIQRGQAGSYVFVVGADRKAELRVVTVGDASGDDVVVDKGLAAGETVVTDGQLRLTPGATVVARGQPQAANGTGQ
jgi:membrane fusion protein, multidrug efflux system